MWRSSKERRNVKTKKKRGQPCESEEGREEWVRERGGGGETTGQTQPVCVSTSLHRIDGHEEDRGKSGRRGREGLREGEMENY